MADQFCLRWNNHQHTLVTVFENLLESETLTDCALGAEGRVLKAHKVVLSACSPYFETMLCVQPEKHPIIFLKDVKYLELKAMLDYMYKGEVNISQERLDSFLKTAEALQIKGLTDQGGGGSGGDAPDNRDPPKPLKGVSRKAGISDAAPESPLVGNVPLREGSLSPAGKRRRRTVRPSMEDLPDSSNVDSNACDNSIGDAPMTAVSTPMTPSHSSETARLAPVRKVEPQDNLVTPKTEIMDEPQEDIEDLTLDDDDEYSNMSKPGTSFGNPSMSSQDFSPWQMATTPGDRTQDEVFMAAQEAINNSQTNTQGYYNSISRCPGMFSCEVCNKVYKYRRNLIAHQRFECMKEKSFRCPLCPYKSYTKGRLKCHVASKHVQLIDS